MVLLEYRTITIFLHFLVGTLIHYNTFDLELDSRLLVSFSKAISRRTQRSFTSRIFTSAVSGTRDSMDAIHLNVEYLER